MPRPGGATVGSLRSPTVSFQLTDDAVMQPGSWFGFVESARAADEAGTDRNRTVSEPTEVLVHVVGAPRGVVGR